MHALFKLAGAALTAAALAVPTAALAEKRAANRMLTLVDANGVAMGRFYPAYKPYTGAEVGTALVVLDLGLAIGPVAVPVMPADSADNRDLTWAPHGVVRFNAANCSGTALLSGVAQDKPGFPHSVVIPVTGMGSVLYATTKINGPYQFLSSQLNSDGNCVSINAGGSPPVAEVTQVLPFVPPFRVR